jgi:hypothetical protein
VPRAQPVERGQRRLGLAQADRLGAFGQRQQLAPFPHAGVARRQLLAAEPRRDRVEVVACQQRLARLRQILEAVGFIALTGQRAFKVSHEHG